MRMPQVSLLKVIIAVATLQLMFGAWPSAASAQSLPSWMKVSPAIASGAALLSAESGGPPPLKNTRRGAYLIAAGVGVALAGTLHAGMLGGRVCYEREDRIVTALPVGLTLAAAGVAMVVAGALKLKRTPSSMRKLRDGDVPGLFLTSVGTAAVASAVSIGIAIPQWAACVSS